jgi:RNA polymerase sigma-70 factor (ECF subfamily)
MNAAATMSCLDTTRAIARYRDMVYGIALTHTRNRPDADDVFQEVFLVYHRKQPPFEDDERCKAWFIVTTLNCAKQLTTSSWSKKVVPLYEAVCEGGAEDGADGADGGSHFRTDEQDAIFSALQELPEKYRNVLHLFYFEDLSVAQISLALGIEPGTVKTQLSRGRAQMRDRLNESEGGHFHER